MEFVWKRVCYRKCKKIHLETCLDFQMHVRIYFAFPESFRNSFERVNCGNEL